MKKITLKIDERAFEQLRAHKHFRDFLEGTCSEPSVSERIIFKMVDKIDKGITEMEVGLANEPLQ